MKKLNEALVNERKKRDVSLEEISRLTNIGLKSLQALEQGDYERIPGKFYLVNYVKSYLHAVGADEKEILDTYDKEIEDVELGNKEKNSAYYTKLRYSRFKKKNVFVSLFIFLLLAAIIFFILDFGKDSFLRKWNFSSKPVPLPSNRVGILPYSNTFNPDLYPLTIDIEFFKGCWMKVNRSGLKLIEKVYQEGDKVHFNGYELQFIIGNPGAVRFFLNGTEVKYLHQITRRETLTITPAHIKDTWERGK